MLRGYVRRGRALTSDERAWLDAYEAARARRPDAPPAPMQRASLPFHDDGPELAAPAPEQPAPLDAHAHDDVAHERRTLDFGAPEDEPASLAPREPERPRCTIPNCPECRKAQGAERCGTTGNPVFPPLDDDEAEALADMLLGGIGTLARMVRADHAPVRPTQRERERMRNATKKLAHRRANFLGEYSDVVAFGFAASVYGRRAFVAPKSDDVPPTE